MDICITEIAVDRRKFSEEISQEPTYMSTYTIVYCVLASHFQVPLGRIDHAGIDEFLGIETGAGAVLRWYVPW